MGRGPFEPSVLHLGYPSNLPEESSFVRLSVEKSVLVQDVSTLTDQELQESQALFFFSAIDFQEILDHSSHANVRQE